MRIFFAAFIGSLLTIPAIAQPQWTPTESAELMKLGLARREHSSALVSLADLYRDTTTEARRPAIASAQLAGVEAEHECHQAIRHLLNSSANATPSYATLARAEVVTRGIAYARSCGTKTVLFAQRLRALGAVALADRLDATVRLNDFAELPFLEWRPVDYPKIIGQHGTFERSADAFQAADLRFLEAYKATIVWYQRAPRWPETGSPLPAAIFGHRNILRYGADYSGAVANMWLINGGVILSGDAAIIAGDHAASSQIRNEDFFAVLRVLELNSNPDGAGASVNFHGRGHGGGANGLLEVIMNGLGIMDAGYRGFLTGLASTGMITYEEALSRAGAPAFLPGGVTTFAGVGFLGQGWEFQANNAIAHSWEALQAYDFWAFGFFHGLSEPPCLPGTHPSNGSCAPDGGTEPCPTCPPAPPPTECQECPPPVICPTFSATLDLVPISGTQGFGLAPICVPNP